MSNKIITLCSVLVALVSLTLWATEKHSGHTPDMIHTANGPTGVTPEEGGHATFAALAEIVAMLEQDSSTDWSKVDIDGLHSHLLDMDQLMMATHATTSVIGDNEIRYNISGNDLSVPAVHRMVAAHAQFIQQSRGWLISTDLEPKGATVTIKVEEDADKARLTALGFYGFMSLGLHHQVHHHQMAKGKSH